MYRRGHQLTPDVVNEIKPEAKMKVREIMTQPVIVVREETTLGEIARIMLANRIGCVPIVDAEGKLVGIVTETDFTAKEHGVPFSTFDAP